MYRTFTFRRKTYQKEMTPVELNHTEKKMWAQL